MAVTVDNITKEQLIENLGSHLECHELACWAKCHDSEDPTWMAADDIVFSLEQRSDGCYLSGSNGQDFKLTLEEC